MMSEEDKRQKQKEEEEEEAVIKILGVMVPEIADSRKKHHPGSLHSNSSFTARLQTLIEP